MLVDTSSRAVYMAPEVVRFGTVAELTRMHEGANPDGGFDDGADGSA
jgi:hypothetical protein